MLRPTMVRARSLPNTSVLGITWLSKRQVCQHQGVILLGSPVNNSTPTIYIHIEPIKRSSLRDNSGNDDGDLYEGTFISDFDPIRVRTFEPKNSDTDESLAPILELHGDSCKIHPLLSSRANCLSM